MAAVIAVSAGLERGEPGARLLAGCDWLALRRVRGGRVGTLAGVFFEGARRIPGYLLPSLEELTSEGLVTVAEGDPLGELRGVGLTEAGRVRYAVLCAVWGGDVGAERAGGWRR